MIVHNHPGNSGSVPGLLTQTRDGMASWRGLNAAPEPADPIRPVDKNRPYRRFHIVIFF